MDEELEISELIGKTITHIEGMKKGEDTIKFTCNDGSIYKMYHDQNCCESVSVDDVVGDYMDLIGSPILSAEKCTNDDDLHPAYREYPDESFLWTFYKLATIKGYVDIKWYGSSNGYYSETVSFVRIDKLNETE